MDVQERYQYFMKPDPNQKEFVGEPVTEFDEFTSKQATYRLAKVGMVRNAKDEDKRVVKVYLAFEGKKYAPHLRTDHGKPLQGWYQDKDNHKQNSRERPCFTEAMLTEPYGGYCTVGCAFCYINSGFRGYRGSGLLMVPLNYGDQVAKELSRFKTAAAGYFSSFVEPFIEVEELYHNTQRGAEAFVQEGLPIFFLSRLLYPDWAVDLLTQNPYSYAQKSLNTGSDEDWAKLSPGAASLKDHLEDLRRLRSRGIYTSIQVNPILPGIISHDHVRNLFEKLAAVGNNHVIVKFVEAGYSWSTAMVERVASRFSPERVAVFKELFTENQPGSQKSVQQAYRLEAHQLYRSWATELGMTYSTCYEYAKGANGKWGSIGRLMATSAQCHGQQVPVYTRRSLGDRFQAVAQCPPSGCLYCGEATEERGLEGPSLCGSKRFGAARALRAPDYKRCVYDADEGEVETEEKLVQIRKT
jgi:DNA repair photolyase